MLDAISFPLLIYFFSWGNFSNSFSSTSKVLSRNCFSVNPFEGHLKNDSRMIFLIEFLLFFSWSLLKIALRESEEGLLSSLCGFWASSGFSDALEVALLSLTIFFHLTIKFLAKSLTSLLSTLDNFFKETPILLS